MVPGPLEGELIRLRAHEPEDVDRAFAWLNDPEVRQFLGRQYPFSRKEVTERLLAAPSFDAAFFAIVRKEDGVLIGDCGLFDASPENRGATLGDPRSATNPAGKAGMAPTQCEPSAVSVSKS